MPIDPMARSGPCKRPAFSPSGPFSLNFLVAVLSVGQDEGRKNRVRIFPEAIMIVIARSLRHVLVGLLLLSCVSAGYSQQPPPLIKVVLFPDGQAVFLHQGQAKNQEFDLFFFASAAAQKSLIESFRSDKTFSLALPTPSLLEAPLDLSGSAPLNTFLDRWRGKTLEVFMKNKKPIPGTLFSVELRDKGKSKELIVSILSADNKMETFDWNEVTQFQFVHPRVSLDPQLIYDTRAATLQRIRVNIKDKGKYDLRYVLPLNPITIEYFLDEVKKGVYAYKGWVEFENNTTLDWGRDKEGDLCLCTDAKLINDPKILADEPGKDPSKVLAIKVKTALRGTRTHALFTEEPSTLTLTEEKWVFEKSTLSHRFLVKTDKKTLPTGSLYLMLNGTYRKAAEPWSPNDPKGQQLSFEDERVKAVAATETKGYSDRWIRLQQGQLEYKERFENTIAVTNTMDEKVTIQFALPASIERKLISITNLPKAKDIKWTSTKASHVFEIPFEKTQKPEQVVIREDSVGKQSLDVRYVSAATLSDLVDAFNNDGKGKAGPLADMLLARKILEAELGRLDQANKLLQERIPALIRNLPMDFAPAYVETTMTLRAAGEAEIQDLQQKLKDNNQLRAKLNKEYVDYVSAFCHFYDADAKVVDPDFQSPPPQRVPLQNREKERITSPRRR